MGKERAALVHGVDGKTRQAGDTGKEDRKRDTTIRSSNVRYLLVSQSVRKLRPEVWAFGDASNRVGSSRVEPNR